MTRESPDPLAPSVTAAVVIARRGSKGLPNKAMQPLLGKPLVGWACGHALAAKRIDHVCLSTDGTQIANVGKHLGIDVFYRPPELATDTATVDAAVRHAVTRLEEQLGETVTHVAILYGNIPLRPDNLVDRAIEKLTDTGCDSVQSVCPVEKNHPLWMKKVAGRSGDELLMYEPNRVYRRQDLPPVYMLDGGVLAMTRRSLFTVNEREPHAFLGKDRRAVTTRPGDVVDVDTDLDLCYARALLEHRGITEQRAAG